MTERRKDAEVVTINSPTSKKSLSSLKRQSANFAALSFCNRRIVLLESSLDADNAAHQFRDAAIAAGKRSTP
jgi:hypothetical protein